MFTSFLTAVSLCPEQRISFLNWQVIYSDLPRQIESFSYLTWNYATSCLFCWSFVLQVLLSHGALFVSKKFRQFFSQCSSSSFLLCLRQNWSSVSSTLHFGSWSSISLSKNSSKHALTFRPRQFHLGLQVRLFFLVGRLQIQWDKIMIIADIFQVGIFSLGSEYWLGLVPSKCWNLWLSHKTFLWDFRFGMYFIG